MGKLSVSPQRGFFAGIARERALTIQRQTPRLPMTIRPFQVGGLRRGVSPTYRRRSPLAVLPRAISVSAPGCSGPFAGSQIGRLFSLTTGQPAELCARPEAYEAAIERT